MPVYKESRFSEYLAAVKAWGATARAHAVNWKEAVREEPALIWQTPAIRYSVYGVGAFLGLCTLLWGLSLFHPPRVEPPARTADFHVVCTNAACARHFVINRKFGFDDFPVLCPACQQKTGQQALRCASKACGGKWVVPKQQGDEYVCSRCAAVLGRRD